MAHDRSVKQEECSGVRRRAAGLGHRGDAEIEWWRDGFGNIVCLRVKKEKRY